MAAFNANQLAFLKRKALENYNAKVLRGKDIKETEYRILYGYRPKDSRDIQIGDIPIPEAFTPSGGEIRKYIEKSKIKLVGPDTEGLYEAILEDIRNEVSEYDSALNKHIDTIHSDNAEKNLRRFFIGGTIYPRVQIAATALYALDVNDFKFNAKDCRSINDLLLIVKSAIRLKYSDFPNDTPPNNDIRMIKYELLIIGDGSVVNKYEDIKAQFSLWDHQIDPVFWDISNRENDIHSKEFDKNTENKNMIGVFIFCTDVFLASQIKYNDKRLPLFEVIHDWAERNNEIPITYVCVSEQKGQCFEQLKWLGKPVIMPEQATGTGIISVFIKAVERFKEKENETQELLSKVESHEGRIGELERNESSLGERLKREQELAKQFKQEKNSVKKKSLVALFFLLFLLLPPLFLLYGKYAKYQEIVKDDLEPVLIISLPDGSPRLGIFDLKVDSTQDKLYISNVEGTNIGIVDLTKIDYDTHSLQKIIYNYEDIAHRSICFEVLNDFLLVSTDVDKKILILEKTITSNYSPKGLCVIAGAVDMALDDIAISPDEKKLIATSYWSDSVYLFDMDFLLSNKCSPTPLSVKESSVTSGTLNPSGVAFVDNEHFLVSLRTDAKHEKKVKLMNLKGTILQTDLLDVRELNDIKYTNVGTGKGIAITCSDWNSAIYQVSIDPSLKHSPSPRITGNRKVELSDGSPTDISISPNGKHAVVAHQNHKRFHLLEIRENGIHKETTYTYNFERAIKDDYKCEGLDVDWKRGIVFIPNMKTGAVYGFKITDDLKQ